MLQPAPIDSPQEAPATEFATPDVDSIVAERNALKHSLANCREELSEAQQQLRIEKALTSSLESKVFELEEMLSQEDGELHGQVQALSAEIADFEYYEHMSHRCEQIMIEREANHCEERASMSMEIGSLHESIRDQALELQMWKNEALKNRHVGGCYCNTVERQVAELIIRERQWSDQIIRRLQNEIEMVRAAKIGEISSCVGGDEASSASSSPLVTSLRGEIALLKLGRESLL